MCQKSCIRALNNSKQKWSWTEMILFMSWDLFLCWMTPAPLYCSKRDTKRHSCGRTHTLVVCSNNSEGLQHCIVHAQGQETLSRHPRWTVWVAGNKCPHWVECWEVKTAEVQQHKAVFMGAVVETDCAGTEVDWFRRCSIDVGTDTFLFVDTVRVCMDPTAAHWSPPPHHSMLLLWPQGLVCFF